jgi:SAM-dependent methyltransferase
MFSNGNNFCYPIGRIMVKNKSSKNLKCLVCGNENIKNNQAKFADFISERVFSGKNQSINLIYCPECGFSYFDYRFNEEECNKLYSCYRDENYQKQRQKYEYWYTKQINDLIGKNDIEIKERKKNLTKIINDFIDISKIKTVLDFGGDKGQHIPDIFINIEKYVYDISDVKVIDSIKKITDINEVKQKKYDFVMCCHTLEHVCEPQKIIDEIKELLNNEGYFYIELPFDSPFYKNKLDLVQFLFNKYFSIPTLIKHFLKNIKNRNFYLMHEHINYFTPKSILDLLENSGFEVIYNETKTINCVWSKQEIIGTLAKVKKEDL